MNPQDLAGLTPEQYARATLAWLRRQGGNVFPLHAFKPGDPESKRPTFRWPTTPYSDASLMDYISDYGHGWGWALPPSTVVADIDFHEPDSKGAESWLAMCDRFQIDKSTCMAVTTHHPGTHVYFRKPIDLNIPKKQIDDFPNVDFLTAGNFVCVPPGRHYKGGHYHWNKPEQMSAVMPPPPMPPLMVEYYRELELLTDRRTGGTENAASVGGTLSDDDFKSLIDIIDVNRFGKGSGGDPWFEATAACYMACGGSDSGFQIFDAWAAQHPQYQSAGDSASRRDRWDSVSADRPGRKISGRTLLRLATESAKTLGDPERDEATAVIRHCGCLMDFSDADVNSLVTESSIPRRWIGTRTDVGNSYRLADKDGRRIRYCHPWKQWLIWDDIRWKPDISHAIDILAKDIVADLFATSVRSDDKDDKRWAMQSSSAKSIAAMVTLTRAEVPILPDALDRDRMILTCPNGTVELATGQLREHRTEDYATKLVRLDSIRRLNAPDGRSSSAKCSPTTRSWSASFNGCWDTASRGTCQSTSWRCSTVVAAMGKAFSWTQSRTPLEVISRCRLRSIC